MKKLLTGVAAMALSTTMMGSTAQACGDVSITEMNWASAGVVTAVSKFLLEQGYGCKVTVVPSSTVPSVASVAETGKPDILTELWVNTAPQYFDLEKEGKLIAATKVLSDGGVEGWWIPDYLAEEHPELKTIDGVLAHPDWVGGMFNNCPEGWGCRIVNDNLKKFYDLDGHGVKVFDHGSGETLAASIAAAYTDKKPWFGYYWSPTAILGRYKMTMVDIGPYVADNNCNSKPDCAAPIKSAYQPSDVLTAITPSLKDREPAVAELMSHVTFSNAQMNEVLAWQEDNKSTPEEAAVHFLTTYKDVWGTWLSDDARTKLAAVLQ